MLITVQSIELEKKYAIFHGPAIKMMLAHESPICMQMHVPHAKGYFLYFQTMNVEELI